MIIIYYPNKSDFKINFKKLSHFIGGEILPIIVKVLPSMKNLNDLSLNLSKLI